jgi:NAD(P)-dependent dehydrogenase (short-subunit alcohol dehydrogenase family)
MAANTYLITGATDGIGKALALRLAAEDATIIMHGRNPEKLEQAVAEVTKVSGNQRIHPVIADFASLAEVNELALQIVEEHAALNILINNAGHLTDKYTTTRDGLESTFGVNYLAPFLLTNKLLDTLIANAPARIVNVSSTAMGGGFLDFSDLQAERNFEGWQAYSNSKLAQIYFTHTLAEKLEGTGVICNSLCPGLIDTNFMHTNNIFSPEAQQHMLKIMRPAEQGADIPYYLATAEETANSSGQFFIRDGIDKGKAIPLAWDQSVAEQLWTTSQDYVSAWL